MLLFPPCLAYGFTNSAPSLYAGRETYHLGLHLAYRYRHSPGQAQACIFDQFVEFAKDESPDLARFDTGRDTALVLAIDTVIALDGYGLVDLDRCRGVEGKYIKGTDHGAHRARDTLVAVYYDDIQLGVATDGPGGTHTHAGGWIAVATLVWKRRGEIEARHDVDEGLGLGFLK
jgi:hypothetical protein